MGTYCLTLEYARGQLPRHHAQEVLEVSLMKVQPTQKLMMPTWWQQLSIPSGVGLNLLWEPVVLWTGQKAIGLAEHTTASDQACPFSPARELGYWLNY